MLHFKEILQCQSLQTTTDDYCHAVAQNVVPLDFGEVVLLPLVTLAEYHRHKSEKIDDE